MPSPAPTAPTSAWMLRFGERRGCDRPGRGRLEAGTVFINKHAEIAPHVPFGGIKCSGLGVEFGEEGLAAYTSIKVINAAA